MQTGVAPRTHRSDGRRFCVMELVRGRTLREVLGERGRLPLAEAVPLLRGMKSDGVWGIRVSHNMDLSVSKLTASKN